MRSPVRLNKDNYVLFFDLDVFPDLGLSVFLGLFAMAANAFSRTQSGFLGPFFLSLDFKEDEGGFAGSSFFLTLILDAILSYRVSHHGSNNAA